LHQKIFTLTEQCLPVTVCNKGPPTQVHKLATIAEIATVCNIWSKN
jgi:hypothetical protein